MGRRPGPGTELTIIELRFDGQGGATGRMLGAAQVKPTGDGAVGVDRLRRRVRRTRESRAATVIGDHAQVGAVPVLRCFMKQLSVGLVLCATMTAALVGQTPKYVGATVTAEKNVEFARFKTYSWTKGQPSFDKTIDAQVVAAVDRELKALGMTLATSGPGDVLAAYYSVSRTDVAVKAKPDPTGARPQEASGRSWSRC